jgi:hypothetical protein
MVPVVATASGGDNMITGRMLDPVVGETGDLGDLGLGLGAREYGVLGLGLGAREVLGDCWR